MKTVRLTLNRREISAIVPGLDHIVERLAARRGTHSSVMPFVESGKDIFAGKRYDRKMEVQLLSAWKKLRSASSSAKVRLNALELSAAALGLRVARKQTGRASLLDEAFVSELVRKVENYRKRAKRAEVEASSAELYNEKANNWRRFVQWVRHNLLYRPRRKGTRSTAMLRKSQRDRIRSLALEIVVESADRKRTFHLADLARREVRQGRHEMTLRELLKDDNQARRFLARFIMDRVPLEMIRTEFQPEILRTSMRAEVFDRARVIGGDESSSVREKRLSSTVISGNDPSGNETANRKASHPTEKNSTRAVPRRRLTKEDVAHCIADWLSEKVETDYWLVVCKELSSGVRLNMKEHKEWADSHRGTDPFSQACCPPCLDAGTLEETEMYAEWGARSLVLLTEDLKTVAEAAKLLVGLLKQHQSLPHWDKMRESLLRPYFPNVRLGYIYLVNS